MPSDKGLPGIGVNAGGEVCARRFRVHSTGVPSMPHILVAEDDATTREMIRGILTKEGYDVSVAADGMRALRILKKKNFDLVLLYIWMSKMSWLVLIGTLHVEHHNPKIFVFTTIKTP